MQCKKCNSEHIVKHGKVRNKQRYECKACKLNFVQGDQRLTTDFSKHKMALRLYLEGMGFRAIGRVLKVSNVTVLKWVTAAGKWVEAHHKQRPSPPPTEVIELDEMWHFVGKKKQREDLVRPRPESFLHFRLCNGESRSRDR